MANNASNPKGRALRVLVSAYTGSETRGLTQLGGLEKDVNFARKPKTASTTTFDDVAETHGVISVDYDDISLDVLASLTDAGQTILRSAGDAGTFVVVEIAPTGVASGQEFHAFRGSVAVERMQNIDNFAMQKFTLKCDNAPIIGRYP